MNGDTQQAYKLAALARVQDIEELAVLGETLHACPYYGTRKVSNEQSKALQRCLIMIGILVKAQLLVQATRSFLGGRIDLRKRVVLAHAVAVTDTHRTVSTFWCI